MTARVKIAAVAFVALLGTAAAPAHADTAPARDRAALVDTLIGTSGGGTFPGAVAPFGAVQWSPDTTSRPAGGGYASTDSSTTGFSLTHTSGAGCAVGGDVPFLPTVGAIGTSPGTATTPLSHTGEVARAGYYAVNVGSPAVSVAMSATPRTAIGAFTYPAGAQANMLLKLTGSADGATSGTATVVGTDTVVGSASGMRACGTGIPSTVYFAATFDRRSAPPAAGSARP
jgi:putative alpha-1,2-mannosidase